MCLVKEESMKKTFILNLNQIDDVKEFVRICQLYDCNINAKNDSIDCKSLMGMFSIDLSNSVDVSIHNKSEKIIDSFADDIKKFVVQEATK